MFNYIEDLRLRVQMVLLIEARCIEGGSAVGFQTNRKPDVQQASQLMQNDNQYKMSFRYFHVYNDLVQL